MGAACKKSKTTTPDPVYPAGLRAKINGVIWTPQYINKVTSSGGGMYSFEFDGTDSATHQALYIQVSSFTGRGVHTITATNDMAFYAIDTGGAVVQIAATSGQIDITALNDTAVGGTFNFVSADGTTVTDGTFNVNF